MFTVRRIIWTLLILSAPGLKGTGALSGVEPVKLLPPAGEYPVFCRPKRFSEAGFAARLAVSADRRLRLDRTDGVPASAAVAIEFR